MNEFLLTGASGFLGKVIKEYIVGNVITLGRSNEMDVICDLSKEVPKLPVINAVIHAAGKAHSVPRTEDEKKQFFDVNVEGTNNLLSALSNLNPMPESFVLISTVAVYGLDSGNYIKENHALDASDAYGMSKIVTESLVQEWCLKNNVICSILRLPLVAGRNPPGNLESMINGINKGYYLNIAGGTAKKTMVLAEDVAKIIDTVRMVGGIYNLSDGKNPSFAELAEVIAIQLGKVKPRNIPSPLAAILARVGDLLGSKSPFNSRKLNKMTANLTFDDSKAREILGWHPTSVLDGFRIK